MKYTSEIVIDLPRSQVVELFDDPNNLTKWQPGLQSFEHLNGTPGQPGATSRLVFDQRGRRIEMIETVTRRNLPDEFAGAYETAGVTNWITNRFLEEGPKKTRWIAETEFRFSGLMRVMALFMGHAFRRQTQELMQRFKAFAEGR